MNTNLLELAESTLGRDFSGLAGQFLGEPASVTQGAVASLLPAVLGGIAQKGATTEGASELISLVNRSNLDVGTLGNIAGIFGSGGAGVKGLMKAGTNSLVPALFGDRSGALISALSSASGLKSSSASNLVAMVVPIALMVLKKLVGEHGLDANSLSSLLAGQGSALRADVDSRLASVLGFGSTAPSLTNAGVVAADSARRARAAVVDGAAAIGSAGAAAGGTVAAAGNSMLQSALVWLTGLALFGLIWWLFTPKAPAPARLVSAPAAKAIATLPAKVYFDTGSAALGADGARAITAAADAIKKDSLKVAITGYTDKAGDAAKNEELAKSRALAVRDALTAAGVPQTNLDMKTPLFVEIGATANDAEARRVEISRM